MILRPILNQKKQYFPTWAAEEFIVPLLSSGIQSAIREHIKPIITHGKVLDVGCGAQPFREYLETLEYMYTSLDVVQNQNSTVQFLGAIDQPLPNTLIQSCPFDFILCTEVMEHVIDWKSSFENFSSLLRTNGRLLITCPHFYPLHEEPYDFWRPTLHAIKYFSQACGFQTMYSARLGNAWDVFGTMLGEMNAAGMITPISSNKLSDASAKIVRWLSRSMFTLIKSRFLHQHFDIDSRLYLSNLVVLEKTII
jgi:SAM-dependent methyltransferase